MKPRWIIGVWLILLVSFLPSQAASGGEECDTNPTVVANNAPFLKRLVKHAEARADFALDQVDLHTYTFGISSCTRQGMASRLFPHVLPFQTNPKEDVHFEASGHIHYQWPGDMQLNLNALRTNQWRKGRQVMAEVFQVILPMYDMRRRGYKGSHKSFVLPFYRDGIDYYDFTLTPLSDSLYLTLREEGLAYDTSHLCCLSFLPRRSHHTLLSGYALVDTLSNLVCLLNCQGRVDMATFSGEIHFKPDTLHQDFLLPYSSRIDIDYHYAGTRAHNYYRTFFRDIYYIPQTAKSRKYLNYDLSSFYAEENLRDIHFDSIRPPFLSPLIDSLRWNETPAKKTSLAKSKKNVMARTAETLLEGTRLGSADNRLRVYGPLDPASFGYDGLNGFTFRERLRWNYQFNNGQRLYTLGEAGYAFGLREFRFRTIGEWTYLPHRRGRLRLEASKNNSSFSSAFIESVNTTLHTNRTSLNFDSLGIHYYQRYEIRLEHGLELANGLMLYTGLLDTYRSPVRHGVRKTTEAQRDALIASHYHDFSPYLRLEWTPRQFYWYNNKYKEYVRSSPSPTLSAELSRAISGIGGSHSHYGRAEIDVQQSYWFNRTHLFAYRVGTGMFYHQAGEYFINYRYFARSQYPTLWEDDRIGGTFHLLDDFWYSSSPSYVQVHTMHETSFGLFHYLRLISRFIIKERIYLSALKAKGKPFYEEVGYGIDNNYFNVGFFMGYQTFNYITCGFKFRIELGRHL